MQGLHSLPATTLHALRRPRTIPSVVAYAKNGGKPIGIEEAEG